MTPRALIENLPAHLVYAASNALDIPFSTVIAGDLMSDILVSIESGALLVTSLATDQAIHTANMVGAAVILLVNDKLPLPSMKTLAGDSGITLLATPLPMFEACCTIGFLQNTYHENNH